METTRPSTDEWLAALEDGRAEARDAADLRAIGEAIIAVNAAAGRLTSAVAAARDAGRSWTEIANVLGTSRQAARQRFACTVPAQGDSKLQAAMREDEAK